MKEIMASNIKKLNFTKVEINEVLFLIDRAKEEIEGLKVSLIGSNINNDHLMDIQEQPLQKIRARKSKR